MCRGCPFPVHEVIFGELGLEVKLELVCHGRWGCKNMPSGTLTPSSPLTTRAMCMDLGKDGRYAVFVFREMKVSFQHIVGIPLAFIVCFSEIGASVMTSHRTGKLVSKYTLIEGCCHISSQYKSQHHRQTSSKAAADIVVVIALGRSR